MQNVSPINSFVSGELSPKLNGRRDIEQYYNSAESLLNMTVEFYGGASKTPGTYYVAEVKDSTKDTMSRPFVFSDTQAYIIEIGEYYMRFYKDNGQIESAPDTPYEIATSYPSSVIRDLQFTQTADVLYVTHPSHYPSKLTRTAHTSWTLTHVDFTAVGTAPALLDENITSTTITPSAISGAGITLTSSVAVFDEDHVGSIWAVGPISASHGYAQIVSVSTGGLQTVAIINTLYNGQFPAGANEQWSEAAWSDYRGWPKAVAIHEGRLYYAYTAYEPQRAWGSGVGAYDAFEIGDEDDDGLVFDMDTNEVEVVKWLFPSNELLVGTAGGLHTYGTGSDSLAITPTNVRRKKKTSYGVLAGRPFQIGNNIYYWQEYGRKLREYVYSLDVDNYLANDATAFSEHISESKIVESAYQQAPYSILWSVRTDGKLVSFTRQIEQKVAAWTTHDTEGDYKSVAVIPTSTQDQVWFVVEREIEGSTVKYIEYMADYDYSDQEDMFFVHSGLTLDSPVDITGMTASTGSGIITVTATSHGFANTNVVKIRGVAGMTDVNSKKYIVSSASTNTFNLLDLDSEHVDGSDYDAYTENGEIRLCVKSVGGLSHLEAEVVQVCVDGASHPDRTVASGVVVFDDTYSQVAVGLGYTGRIKTNDLEISPGQIASQGKNKRVSEAVVNFYETLGAQIGTSDQMDYIIFRDSSMPTDQAIPLYTGVKRVPFPAGWEEKKQIIIEQEQPLPMHVLSIVPTMEMG